MIGRGERYPLARRVTEDEIAPACFGLGNVRADAACLARPPFVRFETQAGAAFAELLPLNLGYVV